MARHALTLLAVLALAGCAATPPMEVAVPVGQRLEPPAELLAPLPTPGRIFIVPGAAVVACLDPAGRDALVGYVDALRQRVAAWQAWAMP